MSTQSEFREKSNSESSSASGARSLLDSIKHGKRDTTFGDAEKALNVSEHSTDASSEEVAILPTGFRLFIIIVALILNVFLVALDMSIVATAIPKITDQFHSLDQVGWYGSAFFLTIAAFQSTWGKLYKYFELKPVFISSSAIFELGSLICGVAPSSTALIVGRAIQGWGAAGLISGVYMIITYIAPPARRPTYTGILGAVFGCSSVAGPLLGGVFTDEVSWRWCFYINLPIGGLAILVIIIYYHTPAHIHPAQASRREQFLQMDFLGTVLTLVSLTCFLLAMQWGGVTKSWGSASVIVVLVISAITGVAFAALEVFQNERSLLIPRLMKNRNTVAFCLFIFWYIIAAAILDDKRSLIGSSLNGANFLFVYYIPIYFQSIHGLSAAQSGIRSIPLIAVNSMVSAFLGIMISLSGGYYVPFMVASGIFTTAGAALVYTLDVDSSPAKYLGYQAVLGVGLGLGIQVPMIAMQALSDPADMAPNTAIILFFQLIGGALFVSAAECLFSNRLLVSLPSHAPGVDPKTVLNSGASSFTNGLSQMEIRGIFESYMVGFKAAWALGLALSAAALVTSFGPQWRSINPPRKRSPSA